MWDSECTPMAWLMWIHQGCFCNCYLSVLGALGIVSGVEHLEATHVTNVAVEIGTIDSVAALSNSSVWTELLP